MSDYGVDDRLWPAAGRSALVVPGAAVSTPLQWVDGEGNIRDSGKNEAVSHCGDRACLLLHAAPDLWVM